MGSNRIPRNAFPPVLNLASGASGIFGAMSLMQVTFIAEAGATITYSRVDLPTANAHTALTATVNAGTKTTIPADWPFYWVSTAGGIARVSGA